MNYHDKKVLEMARDLFNSRMKEEGIEGVKFTTSMRAGYSIGSDFSSSALVKEENELMERFKEVLIEEESERRKTRMNEGEQQVKEGCSIDTKTVKEKINDYCNHMDALGLQATLAGIHGYLGLMIMQHLLSTDDYIEVINRLENANKS